MTPDTPERERERRARKKRGLDGRALFSNSIGEVGRRLCFGGRRGFTTSPHIYCLAQRHKGRGAEGRKFQSRAFVPTWPRTPPQSPLCPRRIVVPLHVNITHTPDPLFPHPRSKFISKFNQRVGASHEVVLAKHTGRRSKSSPLKFT